MCFLCLAVQPTNPIMIMLIAADILSVKLLFAMAAIILDAVMTTEYANLWFCQKMLNR